ncbi:hypothetical protein VPHD148_0262 [Vibrio phage D148]
MMQNLLNDNNSGEGTPGMFPAAQASTNFSNLRHNTEIFMIGGQDSEDEIAAYDALMNRILAGEFRLRSEKESFSNVTGVCTTIVKYYETVTEGDTNA